MRTVRDWHVPGRATRGPTVALANMLPRETSGGEERGGEPGASCVSDARRLGVTAGLREVFSFMRSSPVTAAKK